MEDLLSVTGREGGRDLSIRLGSVWSCRHVLTAAHCLQQDTDSGEIVGLFDDITVTLGTEICYFYILILETFCV